MRREHAELVLHQPGREVVVEGGGNEGVETRTHIHVRVTGELDEQRARPDVAIAVLGPLAGPHVVGHQVSVQRERERARRGPDDLGRVPVGHDAVPRVGAEQRGTRWAPVVHRRLRVVHRPGDRVVVDRDRPLAPRSAAPAGCAPRRRGSRRTRCRASRAPPGSRSSARPRAPARWPAAGRPAARRREAHHRAGVAAGGDDVGPLRGVVEVHDPVGRAVGVRPRHHDAAHRDVAHHLLDQDLVERARVVVGREHAVDRVDERGDDPVRRRPRSRAVRRPTRATRPR